jgi:hypothetical protein
MNCEIMLTYDTPAYMFNVYKNQLSRQTGSWNLTGPKTLPTIWSLWPNIRFLPSIVAEKNATKNIFGWTEVIQYTPPSVERGYYNYSQKHSVISHCDRHITLLSDTDISFVLVCLNFFLYAFWLIVSNTLFMSLTVL